jgi:hypothetical protein
MLIIYSAGLKIIKSILKNIFSAGDSSCITIRLLNIKMIIKIKVIIIFKNVGLINFFIFKTNIDIINKSN